MSDERLHEVTIGELKPYAVKVVVEVYDTRWPSWFADDRAEIVEVLGERALLVEHTGSTSVPGLPAKPVIDVLLVVPDSVNEPSYVPALQRLSYLLRIREPDWLEHRMLRRRVEDGDPHNINLHVFSRQHAADE